MTATGGCQCGLVRYALFATPTGAHICHCRMCQKAFGGYFAPLAEVALSDIAWSGAPPKVFASSAVVERGFCGSCGTPLSFRYTDCERIDISLGSLDRPADVPPQRQYGTESRMPFFHDLHGLPATMTEDDVPAGRLILLKSRQFPDQDQDA